MPVVLSSQCSLILRIGTIGCVTAFCLAPTISAGQELPVAAAVQPPLSPEQVQDLERRVAAAPYDTALRSELLKHYFLCRSREEKAAAIPHILWIINNA